MRKATLVDLKKELWLRQRCEGQITWTNRQGIETPINEMDDQHLINTINMLERNKANREFEEMQLEEALSSCPPELFL